MLEHSFRHAIVTKKITASLDIKFIIARTRVFKCVLATQVEAAFSS